MYVARLYDKGATAYRIRYATRAILRDRLSNEGAFKLCFEMEDEDEVIVGILQRGAKNPRLRRALERSHLVNLAMWLFPRPELAELYLRLDQPENQNETGQNMQV